MRKTVKFFILSGEKITVTNAELKALVGTYAKNVNYEFINERVAIVKGSFDAKKIVERGAYIRLGGYLLARYPFLNFEEYLKKIEFEKFVESSKSFSAYIMNFTDKHLSSKLQRLIGHAIKKRIPGIKVSLEEPEQMVVGIVTGKELLIGFMENAIQKKRWVSRRPRARPFFHPSVLYPKFARAIVNLCQVKENETILDPFSGTGSILIEAGLMGINSIGLDISIKMCKGTEDNLRFIKILNNLGVINTDALMPPIRKIDAIVTDIPYGRCASSKGRNTSEMANNFILCIEPLLSKGRCCVLITPHTVNLNETEKFEIIGKHEIFIHRNLTRVVNILKKI
jgi:tRNA (guanine10-N2)-dimethyltransferase